MAAITVAISVFSSAVYEFLKYCLTTGAPKRDFLEKSLRKSFTKVRDQFARVEPGVWAGLTLGKSIQLQNRLIECLQSPEIDRDEFLRVLKEELEKEGLSSKEAEEFHSRVEDEFIALVNEEAVRNPKVFMAILLNECKKHDVRLDEIEDELRARGLVLDAIKNQLDRIEEKIHAMASESRVIVPTIQAVLRKNHPDPQLSKGMFFRKEPAWVDFEEGFIFERKEVNKIIERLKKCNVHLVVGTPAAGKSVVLKNVGFKLAKRNLHVYYVGLKTYSDRFRPCFEQILRMKESQPVLIIDDANLQPSACEELIRELRSAKSEINVLIGSGPLEEVIRKSPRESSEFEYLSKTTLNAEDASKGIIDLFLRKKHGFSKERVAKASRRLTNYTHDLWVLSWALNVFDPKSNSVDEKRILEKIRDSIRGSGQGADDALFPISVFYQYEIPFDRSYLTEKTGLEERVIDRLIEQSEISQIEHVGERRSLSLAHSSIANLYLRAYQNYPSLGENAKICFQGDDLEYEVFYKCMCELDPTYAPNIVYRLARASARTERRRLLLKLLENKEIENQIHKGIDKETDLDKIENLMDIARSPGELGRKLETTVFHKGFADAVWPKLASETDLRRIKSFFGKLLVIREFTRGPVRHNINTIASILDLHILVPKIEKEKDVFVIDECIMFVRAFDKKLARILIQSLDLNNLSSKVACAPKEGDSYAAFDTISNVTDLDQEAGLYLAKRVDFSKVKDKEDLESLLISLWDFSPSLRARKRLRQVILMSNPRLEEDLNEVRREMEERHKKVEREIEETWNKLRQMTINHEPFVKELKRKGITGEEYQAKIAQWLREHEEHREVIIEDKGMRYRFSFREKSKKLQK